jgi:serine/threonine protein kinase
MASGMLSLGSVIGSGSYGVVYRGSLLTADTETSMPRQSAVAVKALGAGVAGGATREALAEIRLHRTARHESVVGLLAAFSHNGCDFLVLELCELGSIADIISQRGAPLTEPQIAAVCCGALHGLQVSRCTPTLCLLPALCDQCSSMRVPQHLHYACGLIHRDVKGGNLLLTADFTVKLADFGIALELELDQQGAMQSRCGTVIGSPLYMAPELIEHGEVPLALLLNSSQLHVADTQPDASIPLQASRVIDVWALGITAIEMAETRPPHSAMHPPIHAMYKIVRDPPPGLARPDLWTGGFIDFVGACLQKIPGEREHASDLNRCPTRVL